MSLNNESCSSSSDDESFQSSRSIVFSSERSSSPAWSRSTSMTSGISAVSSTSSESRNQLKAKFGPITRPTPTDLKANDSQGDCKVQQQNSQNSSPNPAPRKCKKKSFLPVQSKIVGPVTNMPQPQGWITYPHSCPVYGLPVPHYPPPMMYYPLPPPPLVQMQMGYPIHMPCSVPMPPSGYPPMYSQPQARYVSVQTQYTYTWTCIDYV